MKRLDKQTYEKLQRQVNELYAQGYETWQIANELDITEALVVEMLGRK